MKAILSKVLPARSQELKLFKLYEVFWSPNFQRKESGWENFSDLPKTYSSILLFFTNFSVLTMVHNANWRNFQKAEPRAVLAKVGPEEELFVSLRVATPGRICTGLRTKGFYMPQEANLSLFLILMLSAREGKNLAVWFRGI